MAAFKHISQIQTLADYQKLSKQVLAKLSDTPVKAHFFAKFPFDKKEAPLLLLGDVPNAVLLSVKKLASPPVLGTCAVDLGNALVFGGKIKASQAQAALKVMQITRATRAEMPDDAEGEADAGTARTPDGPAKPVTVPGGPTVSLKPGQGTATARPPAASAAPVRASVPPTGVAQPVAKAASRETAAAGPQARKAEAAPPKSAPPGPAGPAEKQLFAQRMQSVFPQFQKAVKIEGPHQADLRRLFKAAGELALQKDFEAAGQRLSKAEALIKEALKGAPATSAAEGPETEENESAPEIAGSFARSRMAWSKARKDASDALGKLQAAILKTGDPRAAKVSSGVSRVLQRLPNLGATLEAIENAAAKGKDVKPLKKQAVALAGRCAQYVRAGGLVASVRENPFIKVELDKLFAPALQTIQNECK